MEGLRDQSRTARIVARKACCSRGTAAVRSLGLLVQNRDRVVTKDDLIASIWSGRIVSESTLTSRINAVRKAVGDSGLSQKLVRTIPRKDLRFIGLVHTQSDDGKLAQAADHPPDRVHGPSRPVLPLPDRPAIASHLEHERRSGTGVFFRRDQRRYHHGTVKAALVLRDRAQLLILLPSTRARPCS